MRRISILPWIAALVFAVSPFGPTVAAPRCYPTNRFVVSGGMVQDTLTQLVWEQDGWNVRERCSRTMTCTWAEAKAFCSGITLGGFSDWRLPTIKELLSIVDLTVALPGPTINQTAFPSTPAEAVWTSSPVVGSSGYAWLVSFSFGSWDFENVGTFARVRCVR